MHFSEKDFFNKFIDFYREYQNAISTYTVSEV